MKRFAATFTLLLLPLLFAACRPEAVLPTPAPTAALPTPVTPSATAPLSATNTIAAPTKTATATATAPVAVTAGPTPTPVIGPVLTIDSPADGAQVAVSGVITATGFAHVVPGMTIQVGVTSPTGVMLAATEATVSENTWQATVPLPETMTGAAVLDAVAVDAGGGEMVRRSIGLRLIAGRESATSYVQLYRPEAEAIAVAGHSFFIDGQLWRNGGGYLQVAILMNECTDNVADMDVRLQTSSYWWTFLHVPDGLAGPGCVAAWVGTPGEEDWRAAQIPITVLARDNPLARDVVIANPRSGRTFHGGDVLLINGVAYNAPGLAVNIKVSLPNGEIIAEMTDQADYFGYWTTEVALPAGTENEVLITASIGDPTDPIAETEAVVNLLP